MYELFLTTTVSREDFEMASALLQGLTWMTPRHTVHRVLNYAGPAQPRGLPKTRTFQPLSPAAAAAAAAAGQQQAGQQQQQLIRQFPLWQELGKHLSRASYVLQLAYEVFPETDFPSASAAVIDDGAAGASGDVSGGNGTNSDSNQAGVGGATEAFAPPPATDLNATPGLLRWTDFPDPLRDSPVTQRKKVEIAECRNLLLTMADNNHSFRGEMIQESYTFVRGSVEFVFTQYYHLPDAAMRALSTGSGPSPTPAPGSSSSSSSPAPTLPAWADLRPVDPARKWILSVRLSVVEDNQPEKMQKATDELLAVRGEMERLFEFKVVDRRVFDTRMAALPVGHGIRVP
ncbi:mediator complex, subunit Med18 [Microdochium bolleyi]|uniref:Mediator of RNA polymerase II transcription subunit 18 n=1 Tax=Microdochium bolleyi TaxID=196109 RepID=A0A136JHL6_9PEZI|nr:mediator complex, subunit Med18 [Microdochium bolleyi]